MQTRTKVWKYKHLFPFYNIWDVKACRAWLFKEILVLRTFLKKRSHEMENGWYVPGFVVLYNLYKNRLHIVILKSLPLLVKCPFFFLNGFSCTLNSNAQCDWLFRADPANPSHHHHHHHVGLKHVASSSKERHQSSHSSGQTSGLIWKTHRTKFKSKSHFMGPLHKFPQTF